MLLFYRIRDILIEGKTGAPAPLFLSLEKQIDSGYQANQKMAWGIEDAEFEIWKGARLPVITDADLEWGYDGVALFYGFGVAGRL